MSALKKIAACTFVLALSACGPQTAKQDDVPEAAPSVQATTEPSEIADGYTGVSSDSRTYPLTPYTDRLTSGAAAGAQGSPGPPPEFSESAEELSALQALQALTAGMGIESIIPPDGRTRVTNTTQFPESAMVLIALPSGRCSGAMVGPNLVITAGHCVHSGGARGAWMTSAVVYPGRNGTAAPFGSCSATRFYSVTGWTQHQNAAYDFGAIKLNCDIGNRTGWLGFWWQTASLVGMQSRISSYPGDRPLEQWTHTDRIISETALQTSYQTDTMPGNSGSGVFAQSGQPAGCNGPCVHTVHAYGSGGGDRNSGTRITRPLFDNLVRWKAE